MWTVDQGQGHLDCVRILSRGQSPKDLWLVLTCCGANNMAVIDGEGKVVWEKSGAHFESINVGKIFPDCSGSQILVDIDHQPLGKSPLWVLDQDGNQMGQIMGEYCRHHSLLDWTGDGYAELIVAHSGARGLAGASIHPHLRLEFGMSSASAPQAVLGSGPRVNSKCPPTANWLWWNQALSKGLPSSLADWMYMFSLELLMVVIANVLPG